MVRVGVTLYNDGVTVRPLPPAADAQGPPRTPCQPARLTAPGQCTRTQLSCPIGFAKSEQKHECCYAALANLPPRHRFSKNAIQLLELTNSKAFKRYDAACVLSGVRSEPMASASASRCVQLYHSRPLSGVLFTFLRRKSAILPIRRRVQHGRPPPFPLMLWLHVGMAWHCRRTILDAWRLDRRS